MPTPTRKAALPLWQRSRPRGRLWSRLDSAGEEATQRVFAAAASDKEG